MSFSLNSAETSYWAEYVALFVTATLFLMARYGHRLGASLRDESGVPRIASLFFESLGWVVSICAGLLLGLVLLHIAPIFFAVGLSMWIYPCIGKTWLASLVTLGPLLVVHLHRDAHHPTLRARENGV